MKFLMLSMLVAAFAFGCGTPSTALGSTTIGGTELMVAQEGTGAAGSTTRFVIKPTGGRGTIQTVEAWVGIENAEGSTRATASYDPADGDFDADVTVPSPRPANSRVWIRVQFAGSMTNVGSVALAP